MLLTRDQFREQVFARDSHQCVVCMAPAQDAHHLLERRLWPDGGYYLNNGVSLCGGCHLKAESTEYGVEYLREQAGICETIVPPHMYDTETYDKWGNLILPNCTRLKGELYDDPSVQKVMGCYNALVVDHVKYPRTYHLPWSPGLTNDDRQMPNTSKLEGQEVVVTLKMDGENTTMYSDYIHARSLSYTPHPSRGRIKALHTSIAHHIPEGWRICGENLVAKHSIHYLDLPSYFLVFSVWDDRNVCLDWDNTVIYTAVLGLKTVKAIYKGVFDQKAIETAFEPYKADHEGYVVRTAGEFHLSQFRYNVGKYVRANHVQTDEHWSKNAVVLNRIKEP